MNACSGGNNANGTISPNSDHKRLMRVAGGLTPNHALTQRAQTGNRTISHNGGMMR
ncbi:hypothetical protein ASAP_1269 [Asaia bogorensis]|uniref:Uncharacterized protein n=1 Tax=Asaia bogorensis TaxID=91915 RepID=A0A060QDX4_9PROT|nr:hypothetical protein ASAP_1269 [Asaia bogorensis]